MSWLSPPKADGSATQQQDDAEEVLRTFREFLRHPALERRIDLAVLARIAADEAFPPRERRRAAEALGTIYLKAVEIVATLGQVREEVVGPWGRPKARKARTRRQRPRKAEAPTHSALGEG